MTRPPGACLSICALVLLSAWFSTTTSADPLPMDSTAADPNHFDFAVPDAPAFQLLTVDPKSILRPGTRRELALMTQNASLDNFAIECAPFLLSRDGQIPLDRYRSKRALYTFRVSLGAKTPENGPTSGGAGLRFSLLDSSDPYMNEELLAAAAAAGAAIQGSRTTAQDEMRAQWQILSDRMAAGGATAEAEIRRGMGEDPVLKLIAENDRAAFLRTLKEDGPVAALASLDDSLRNRMIDVSAAPKIQAAENAFDAQRLKFKNRWNRDILEAAAGMGFAGGDSIARSLHANAYSMWVVGGLAIKTRGQLLLGANGSIIRDAATRRMGGRSASSGMRFFYGSNQVKAVAGFDLKATKDHASKYSGELGAEFQIVPSLWVIPGMTLSHTPGQRAEVEGAVAIRYSNLGKIPVWGNLQPTQK